jgi:hypothetical protein
MFCYENPFEIIDINDNNAKLRLKNGNTKVINVMPLNLTVRSSPKTIFLKTNLALRRALFVSLKLAVTLLRVLLRSSHKGQSLGLFKNELTLKMQHLWPLMPFLIGFSVVATF